MPGKVQVVEVAEATGPRSHRDSRAWLVATLTFAVGLLAGSVFFGSAVTPTPSSVPGVTPTPPPIPVDETEPSGLADVVPGFADALVAVVRGQAGVDYLLWPIAKGPTRHAIPVAQGDAATIDPSGIWIATLTDVPDSVGEMLALGRFTGIRPVLSGVDSYAWHDSAVGMIGFLRHQDGAWGLYDASAFPVPRLRLELGEDHPGTLVAYGDWGWALQRSGRIDVVSEAETVTIAGTLLDTQAGDFLVHDSGSVSLIGASGADIVLDQAEVSAGAFSPDGSKLAILDSSGVTILGRDGSLVSSRQPLFPRTQQLSWAGERFVLIPASPRGVRILDLETGAMTTHLTEFTVHWVGVIPLSAGS